MNIKTIAEYFGIAESTLYNKTKYDLFEDEIKEEYEIIKNLSTNDLITEYIKLYKELQQLKKEVENIDEIKAELEDKREKFKILLHRYEHISAINIEYLKRYGEIKGL